MPSRKASGSRQRAQNALPLPTAYPGLIEGKGMDEARWTGCKEILEGVYKAKDGSRKVSDIFRELPDKDEYEDYYQAIPEPECLDNIAKQLGSQSYANPEAFFKQLHLVFLNAKHYNEDDSLLWADAKRLEDQIHADWKQRAEAGVLSNPDPYHSMIKPSRKKRGISSNPSKSATPLPDTKLVITLPSESKGQPPTSDLPTIPEVAPVAPEPKPRAIPTPPIPTPQPVVTPAPKRPATPPKDRLPAAVPASIAPPSPTLSEKARQTQAEMDRSIIAALDNTLPRWPGPKAVLPGPPAIEGILGSGWFGEGDPHYEQSLGGPAKWPQRIKTVVDALAKYRDPSGERLSEALDILPATCDIPRLSFTTPITFANIRDAAQTGRYPTLRDFDIHMTQLFEKGRRYFHDGSVEYGKVLVLQRLYNALTAVYPMPVPGSGAPDPSPTLFASLPAGPGNARSLHETTQELKAGAAEEQVGHGITTFRVGSKDRYFTEEARHKGDFVHLINPDDATRPIVGQIFKTFVPSKGYRTHHVTVCWYYRPEQTIHTPDRRFFEREVFKTGHFCDHPVEDIIEKIAVQFYVKYIRGRPRPGEYYPGWPIYVCHSRFNDRENLTVRIKNWNSCIPDELRQTDFMSIIPFERNIEVPMVSSPFLRGVQGPGFFGEPKKGSGVEDEDEDDAEKEAAKEREAARRKERTKRETIAPPVSDVLPVARPPAVPVSVPIVPQAQVQPQPAAPGPSRLPSQPAVQQSLYRPPSQPTPNQPAPSAQPAAHLFPKRTFAATMGGGQVVDQTVVKERLSNATAKLFDRDPQGHVLWFSGPPLPSGAIRIPEQQSHSLEYLTYLVKRKAGGDAKPQKRPRPDQQDELNVGNEGSMWWAEGQKAEEVEAALRAVIDGVEV
ncbi:hypothetical protein IAU60_005742 [Kwoniella sp. DSM 27419]